jgi:hypothetical protein
MFVEVVRSSEARCMITHSFSDTDSWIQKGVNLEAPPSNGRALLETQGRRCESILASKQRAHRDASTRHQTVSAAFKSKIRDLTINGTYDKI